MDPVSDNNPQLDEMRERGWAWIIRSDGKYGAPVTDDEYAAGAVERMHPFDEGEPLENRSEEEIEKIVKREGLPERAELMIVSL